jgi:hypothetical protein
MKPLLLTKTLHELNHPFQHNLIGSPGVLGPVGRPHSDAPLHQHILIVHNSCRQAVPRKILTQANALRSGSRRIYRRIDRDEILQQVPGGRIRREDLNPDPIDQITIKTSNLKCRLYWCS